MKTTVQYNGDAIASLEPGQKATLHCALEIMATDIVVESDELKLQEKTITPTGEAFTEYPEEGYDGFGQVAVAGDANLVAENIKSGVTIYGVEGTHKGGTAYITVSSVDELPNDAADGTIAVVEG